MTVQDKSTRAAPGWYWWAAMLASSLAMGIGAVVISVHLTNTSLRQLCSIVVTMDDDYRSEPPSTPTGERLAGSLAELRRELGCLAPQ
ncbi:hypothetical protein [Winogradskya humida]|uniref:Uncharacterized protein n=1 Tax=Winogradskya humida TaxID=113566 RepID=A0ABQ4A770_9ACTN|nr:hypothetical protein [Actinoplanes humidus]GIE26705.1 hypothetical protein Ahu01nite_098070 [Actinoplanes humidus]